MTEVKENEVEVSLDFGYEFKNVGLLDLALTQSGADSARNNERLEFVGDRVLGLVVAEELYAMFPNESEGELARRHAKLVSTNTLSMIARRLQLQHHLRHGHMTGGKLSHILANAMEAIIGAVFVDGGWRAARELVRNLWMGAIRADAVAPKDPKTKLQELVQKQANGALPQYEYMAVLGESNTPEFEVSVSALGYKAKGRGTSKKLASIDAAAELLKILAI